MTKIFEKHETLFCLLLIALYLIVNLFCQQSFGLFDYRSTIINSIFSLFLIVLMILLKRLSYYGMCRIVDPKKYLYFLPLVLITSVNLWNGININNSKTEILFYILTMINVGFIEEIIFRGFLFKMMEKDNVKVAIIVTSLTFGIGHVINLLNGADIIQTLLQICYAVSIGYLFVIIFYKSKSIIPCIIAHSLTNALSIFNIDNSLSLYIAPIFLIIVPIIYAFYINKKFMYNDCNVN